MEAFTDDPLLSEAALRSSSRPLATLDAAGMLRAVSSGLARMLERDADELVGRALEEVGGPELGAALERARREGSFRGALFLSQRAGGGVPPVVSLQRIDREGAVLGFVLEASEHAPGQRDAYVRLLEDLGRLDDAMRGVHDVEVLLSSVLDVTLRLFDCDRAFLLHPADPDTTHWTVPLERTRPEYPGVLATLQVPIPLSDEAAGVLRTVLAGPGPVPFGDHHEHAMPASIREHFQVRSQLCMSVHPTVGPAWVFGLHQCSHDRAWSGSERALMQEIGRRVTDALSMLLTQQELRASERRFRALVDGAADAFLLVRADGRLLHANRRACDALGRSREELLSLPAAAVRVPEPPATELPPLDREPAPDEPPTFQALLLRADGATVPVEVHRTRLELDGEPVFLELARDVRARRHAESERLRAEELLARSRRMEALGRLAAGVAHEFNNMLLPILGWTELLETSSDPDERREMTQAILTAADRCKALTQRLLAVRHEQVLQLLPTDLCALVREQEPRLRAALRPDVALRLELADAPCVVRADPTSVSSALTNLAWNAQDAMPRGGPLTIRVGVVELDATDCHGFADVTPGPHGVVSVTDAGEGMDEDQLQHAFDPFFSTKQEHGSGLGLATVYGIARQNRGHVRVDSRVGAGSTFRLLLPLAARETAAPPPTAPAARVGARVLLVEDDEAVRRVTQTMLRSRGFEVRSAEDAEHALRLVGQRPGDVDVLLTDVVMPGMNGRVLAERVRGLRPGLPVVFMSGYSEHVLDDPGTLDRRTRLLPKPFTLQALVGAVRDVLVGADLGPRA